MHHSQVMFTRAVAQKFRYREEAQYEQAEDGWFCNDVLKAGHRSGYIKYALSKYDRAGVWFKFKFVDSADSESAEIPTTRAGTGRRPGV